VSSGQKSFTHISTTQAGLLIVGYPSILGSVFVNTAGTGGGSVLTIFDGTSAAAPAVTVAVCNTQNAAIPSWDFNIAMSRGIFVTLTAGTTTQSDITITYD